MARQYVSRTSGSLEATLRRVSILDLDGCLANSGDGRHRMSGMINLVGPCCGENVEGRCDGLAKFVELCVAHRC